MDTLKCERCDNEMLEHNHAVPRKPSRYGLADLVCCTCSGGCLDAENLVPRVALVA